MFFFTRLKEKFPSAINQCAKNIFRFFLQQPTGFEIEKFSATFFD
jgi:hypothetical protein